MRIGVKLDNYGPQALDLLDTARVADEAGFTSGWISDRLVNPAHQASPYPFTPDNSVPWPSDTPFLEATVSLAAIAVVTTNLELAAGVMVLPIRNPVTIAKQFATIDQMSNGRALLGVGVGWMKEEFDAVGTTFKDRGARTDESMQVIRTLWQGRADEFSGTYYNIAEGTHAYPTPAHRIPMIIGGMTPAAIRRAGRLGDGWFGIVAAEGIDLNQIRNSVDGMHREAEEAGRDPSDHRAVLAILGEPTQVAGMIKQVAAAGVTDLVLLAPLDDVDNARRALETVATEL